MRSPVFLVSRAGSRSLHHISLIKAGFDLVLSNSSADSRSLKHELLFSVCSYRVWSTCIWLEIWTVSQSRLAVNDLYGGFFFFRVVYFNLSDEVSRVMCYEIKIMLRFAGASNPLWKSEHRSPGFACNLWSLSLVQPPTLLRKDKCTVSSVGLCLDLCGAALNH